MSPLQIDVRHDILDGPSTDDLLRSLRRPPDTYVPGYTVIRFKIAVPGELEMDPQNDEIFFATINSMERGDDPGESWNLRGRFTQTPEMGWNNFKANFSTRKRKGVLTPL